MSVLAIDAGTTGVTALVVTAMARWPAAATRSSASTSRGQAGWSTCPRTSGRPPWPPAARPWTRPAGHAVSCIGITNQRETAVIWDRATLAAPRRAIVWQDRRTAGICARLREQGHEARVTELTGLRLDPYFTGTKLTWLAEHEPGTWPAWPTGRWRSARWTPT